jgi:putative hydrolase of the HAD superfamily
MMPVKTLIFDLGNVIIDLKDEQHWWEEVFLSMFDRQAVLKLQQHGLFRNYESGLISDDAFLDSLSVFLKDGFTQEDIRQGWIELLGDLPRHRLEALETLKQSFDILLLSNTNDIHLQYIHKTLEDEYSFNPFDRIFRKQYYSHHLGTSKPEKEIYSLLIKDSGIIPEEALFMDDKPENLSAASTLGIRTLHIPKGSEFSVLLKNLGL